MYILSCNPRPDFKGNYSTFNDSIGVDKSNINTPELFKWHSSARGSHCGPIYFLDENYTTKNFMDSTFIQIVPAEITFCIIKIHGVEETLYLKKEESKFNKNVLTSEGLQENEIAVFINGEVDVKLIINYKIQFQIYSGIVEIVKFKRKSIFKIRGGLIC